MTFKLQINCDNAAFEGNPGEELARLLREEAKRLEANYICGTVVDINGNRVGSWEISDN